MTATFEITQVPANLLTVDPAVQRPLDPRRVARIAAAWDDLAAGVLTVSHREDGSRVVLDGQTRLAAYRQVCTDDTCQPLNCQVYTGLELPEEAAMFLEHNDRKAVSPRDRFRLSLVANEQWATDIAKIAAASGWYVEGTGALTDRTVAKLRFQAVGAVEKVYRMDQGAALERVFDTVSRAWEGEKDAVCAETLYGLGRLYARHGGDLDVPGFIVKLRKRGLHRFLSGVGEARLGILGSTVAQAAYRHAVEVYNLGRKSRRIEV